jgi:hypothetical protein
VADPAPNGLPGHCQRSKHSALKQMRNQHSALISRLTDTASCITPTGSDTWLFRAAHTATIPVLQISIKPGERTGPKVSLNRNRPESLLHGRLERISVRIQCLRAMFPRGAASLTGPGLLHRQTVSLLHLGCGQLGEGEKTKRREIQALRCSFHMTPDVSR